jgi:hypothetical protein
MCQKRVTACEAQSAATLPDRLNQAVFSYRDGEI